MVTLADGQRALAHEWDRSRPQTTEEIASFYKHSEAMKHDLDGWHDTEFRRDITAMVLHVAKDRQVKSVLDIGCGRGDDLAALADDVPGIEVLHGVEPNDILRKEALHKLRTKAPESVVTFSVVSHLEDRTPEAQYDLVLMIDVLEHIPDAPGFLAQAITHVPVGGILIEHTPTWDIQNPTHLRVNWGWSPGHQLRRAGFKVIGYMESARVWERVGMASAIPSTLIIAAYRTVEAHMLPLYAQLREHGNWNLAIEANDALVQRARSMAVSKWWREDHADVFLMVDADISFNPAQAQRMVERCRNGYPVICGAYAVRGGNHLATRIRPGETVSFRDDAEPVEIDYAATGFLAVHRSVIDALRPTLPIINAESPELAFWTFFDTQTITHPNGNSEFLSEDWDFSKKCREAGFPVYLDPSVRLGHIGQYTWELEDFGRPKKQALPIINIHERWNAGMRQEDDPCPSPES